MWPQTRLTELLGIAYPIVQAPMAGFSMPALAAAVSNAGGLGSLGSAMLAPEQLRDGLRTLRAATNRPVNANFFVHAPPTEDPKRRARMRARLRPYYDELGIALPEGPLAAPPPFSEAVLEVVLGERPSVVSFHYGLPEAAHLEALRDAGVRVLSSATTVEEARWLEAQGVAAVIAQGYEAGGHRGSFMSPLEAARIGTIALVPQIVDAVACPVIAAGGIMDGRGIAAALLLGASAVQLGTAFLGCPEASVSPLHRTALRASDGTRVTRAFTGKPARVLANRYALEMADAKDDVLAFPLQRALTAPLAQAAAARGSGDFMPLYAGQGAPLTRELPAAELLETLVAETERAFAHHR
ncbi:MAG TPA: nitronate monooxygenase [Geminicoccaceae bacterium]|nr:nitronate monooxygenase [Geminicoccaceae bacterium]